MSEGCPTPDVETLGGPLLVETVTSSSIALLGAGERNDQIELGATIDHPANAAKNPIHFAKRSETIDINRHQTRGLREQFLVCHSDPLDKNKNTLAASEAALCRLVDIKRKSHCTLFPQPIGGQPVDCERKVPCSSSRNGAYKTLDNRQAQLGRDLSATTVRRPEALLQKQSTMQGSAHA